MESLGTLQRELHAYGLAMLQANEDFADARRAAACRKGALDSETLKHPLLVETRKVVQEMGDVLEPGNNPSRPYCGSHAGHVGKEVMDALRNRTMPMSKAIESLVDLVLTLVDRRRNFYGWHLNGKKNPVTAEYVLAVDNPFDRPVHYSDGLLLNDFWVYEVATHAHLSAETVKLRLATMTSVTPDKKVWLAYSGPPGTGKTTAARPCCAG